MKQEKQKQKSMRKREIAKGIGAMVVMSGFIYASLVYSLFRRKSNEKR